MAPYAEPVAANELQVGHVYFAVQFIDEEMLIPSVEPLVYLGSDTDETNENRHLFQDAESYRSGIRIDHAAAAQATIYSQRDSELNHIFEYQDALDVLLRCSMRRAGTSAA